MNFAERLQDEGYRVRFRRRNVGFELRDAQPKKTRNDDAGGDPDPDGLSLKGIATPFMSITRIREWFDEFDEQFAHKAFDRTIGHDHQVMMFEHGDHPMIGSIPIADIRRLEPVKRGLEVSARVFDNWLTLPVRDALKARVIPGMSIMFRPVSEIVEQREDDVPLVTITEAELRELGPVLFPAYKDTEVDLRSSADIDRLHYVVESVRSSLDDVLAKLSESTQGGAIKDDPADSSDHSATRKEQAVRRLQLMEMEL